MSHELHMLGVAELAALLDGKQVSSVELTKDLLARVAAHEALGAFLAVDEEVALAQAGAADLWRARGIHGAFVDGVFHRTHAAAPCVRRNAILVSALSASSTSESFDSCPKLTRKAAFAKSGATPIAPSTRLERTLPDEQAAPELTATPSRSMAITAVSAVIPASAKFEVFGKRGAVAPNTTASFGNADSKRSRIALTRAASPARSFCAHSTATAKPTRAAPFSVPGRRPRSWPPPKRVVTNGAPGASTKAPAPGGPPSLWLETTR